MTAPERLSTPPLIDLSRSLEKPWARALWWSVGPLVERLLRIGALNGTYAEALALGGEPGNFFEHCLRALGVDYEVSEDDLARIPAEGPLITVSNHPFGGLDGIVLGALLMRRRPDFRLLVNRLLLEVEPLRAHIIAVDVFGGRLAAQGNLKGVRESLRWLKAGGALGLFPSGTVSHLHLRRRQIIDPQWVANLGGLIRRSGAPVIPIYFEGRNSDFFQAMGLLHPRLRTALLGRELIEPSTRQVRLRVGNLISPSRLQRCDSDAATMSFLRLKTYILQNRQVAEKTSFLSSLRRRSGASRQQPIAAAIDPGLLQAEVERLPPEQCLVEHGEYRVFQARARQIPNLLQEIGRLREVTFRAVGEGTGMAFDLDRFDQAYIHLFMWNMEKRELVGAYRLGPTDEILRQDGRHGLYTTTLFRYKPGVLQRLNPALELGRSFIVAEYQRKHLSLGLIWRGIGQFVVRNPHYRVLFGPVSISREYQSLSKNLIVMYLKENTLDPDYAAQVRARKPPRSRSWGRLDKHSFNATVRDIEDVSALVSEIEREERGVPVLLKQYLKLNATMLSFNVDPEFNDCIDGLVLVDLVKTNEKTLRRYMGDAGVESFYAYHEHRHSARAQTAGIGE